VSLSVVQWSKSAGKQGVLCTIITKLFINHIRKLYIWIFPFYMLGCNFMFVILCYCVCNFCVMYRFECVCVILCFFVYSIV
jgi:hypothetical protein